jgi:hypothetical protein
MQRYVGVDEHVEAIEADAQQARRPGEVLPDGPLSRLRSTVVTLS